MTGTLAGRTAIVTGGAGAFGRAIGKRLSQAGATVALVDIDQASADEAAAELGGSSFGVGVDVSRRDLVAGSIAAVARKAGGLDIVVNNAGAQRPGGDLDMADDDWDRVVGVNLTGTFNVTKAAIRFLAESDSGRVISIGSRVWLSGGASPAYAATKAGLVGFTRNLARSYGSRGITANVVAPSGSPTGFDIPLAGGPSAGASGGLPGTLLGRFCRPEDVAGAVLFLAGPDASFITGEVIHVCGGSQLAA